MIHKMVSTIPDANASGVIGPNAWNAEHVQNIVALSANTVLATTYDTILASGTIALTLPDATTCKGQPYLFKNVGSGTITINTSAGQTIDGSSAIFLASFEQTASVFSDGANWNLSDPLSQQISSSLLNVKAFGATGNGTTDDTAAIQAAINACDSTSGLVYFPAGNYKISTTLTNSADLIGLVGDGSAITTISTNGSWTGTNGITVTPAVSGTKTYGLFVDGLTITGPGAGSPAIISNYAIAGGVATITAANSFTAGQAVLIQGMATLGGAKLNNNFVTVLASGLSGSQFEFNTSLGDDAGGADTGVATLDSNGIAVVNSGTNSDGPYNLRMLDVQSSNWQGDGFKIVDAIVSSWKNCIGASNGGNGFGFYSDNLTGGGLSGTSCHFDTCYGNGNYKAGFYAYLLLYSAFTNCASDGDGAAYFMERCEGIGFYSCGFESLVYRNVTYPAHGFWSHGSRAVELDGCRAFIGSGNNVASCSLQVDTTLTQGSQSSANIGARNFRVTGSGSATQPTNDFFLDSNTTACIIDGFSFFSATNFTNSGTNNRIWINGSFRSPLVTLGTVNIGGLLTASAGLDVTGNTVLTGQLRVSGSITASGGVADLFNSDGTLTAAQDGDVLIFTGATAGTADAGAFSSVKVYGFHSNLNSVTITGTPNFTAEFHAAGQCTAGTTNYGFYEDGANPNFLGGALTVAGIITAQAGLSITGKISKYNGVVTAGNGVASEIFQVLAPALTANYNSGTAKTLFTPTAAAEYRITWSQAIVIPDGVSSTFPSLTLSWTDVGGIARTKQLVATSTTNTTAVESDGAAYIYTNGSTAVQVTSASYASGTPATMNYSLALSAESL